MHLNLMSMLKGFFAPHDQHKIKDLRAKWVYKPWVNSISKPPTPILEIRDYFGEKIAIYFAWLDFYTQQLQVPAAVGMITFLVQKANGPKVLQDFALIFFSAVICLWSTMQGEWWKQRNAFLNLWWGMDKDSSADVERPTFVGILRYSPLDDRKEMYHRSTGDFYKKLTSCLT